MTTLTRGFHISFWMFVASVVTVLLCMFTKQGQAGSGAIWAMWAATGSAVSYAVFVGLLADRFERGGALWAVAAFLLSPIGTVVTYFWMWGVLRSGAVPRERIGAGYSPGQKRWHWMLLTVLAAVFVVANVLARVFRLR